MESKKPKKLSVARIAFLKIINMLKNNIRDNALVTFEEALRMDAITPHIPEMIQTAIYYKNIEALKIILRKGYDLNTVPAPIDADEKGEYHPSAKDYKPTPHIVYAATRGSL